MPTEYLHGTYGDFAASEASLPIQTATLAVYFGTAPINLIRGYADEGLVNTPVLLNNFAGVRREFGYSDNWDRKTGFTLCEAFKIHFDNTAGNAGPICCVNVLDPDIHRTTEATTVPLTFVNRRATITSDKIILDTLALADKVEGTDYSVDYDFTKGQVILSDIGATPMTGEIQASYYEVTPEKITQEDIIGGVTANGVYTGLGVMPLIKQYTNMIPNIVAAPGWSQFPDVYNAMLTASIKIDSHWNAFVVADIPIVVEAAEAGEAVVGEAEVGEDNIIDTIDKAIAWQEQNSYTSENSKVGWPMSELTFGGYAHNSTIFVWRQLQVDATHNGVPFETASNKAVPVKRQYFGPDSKSKGFMQTDCNRLNEKGIFTTCYGVQGTWVLWGGHTAAFEYNNIQDMRSIFDTNIRMMMYTLNTFQQRWAPYIDQPMTVSMADTIRAQEQAFLDALKVQGAFVGEPVIEFRESDNSISQLAQGDFIWYETQTPTPQFKSGTLHVAFTDEGYTAFYGDESEAS